MAECNVPEFLASRLQAAGTDLYNACNKMPADRIAWHPETEGNAGRDALDQALECAYLNEWAAACFRGAAANSSYAPVFNGDEYKSKPNSYRSAEAALPWLHKSTNALVEAVRAFPASRLDDQVTNPIIGKATSWAEFADFFYWNTVYHEGQVNYIQVLYGDMS